MRVSQQSFSFLSLAALVIAVALIIGITALTLQGQSVPDAFFTLLGLAGGSLFGLQIQPGRAGNERTRKSDGGGV